jgi:hypothetical protein
MALVSAVAESLIDKYEREELCQFFNLEALENFPNKYLLQHL